CPERLQSLIPPENFGAVLPRQIYRSSFPQAENYAFLKSLKLKTVLTVVPEPYPDEHVQFMRENGIQHITVHIRANKEEIRIDTCQMAAALGVVLDRSNYPLLIHCNKGKHRTGCVVGSFRKVLGESMENIIAEYHAYAGAKARTLDERFLETFDERVITWLARSNFFLPP
ncbi:protein-tyrosine phosphatase, partial [Patellaria atrata CBS 101060]